MKKNQLIKVGIGFATGRKSFQKVLNTQIYNWKESGLVDNKKVALSIFVAYDLSYNQTKKRDYINIQPELAEYIDGAVFLGKNEVNQEIEAMMAENLISRSEARSIFGKGYAAQRNIVLYSAIKHGMDYLIFLDDDEYPIAVTNTHNHAIWGGQAVLAEHIANIGKADLTHGHHCGYISPIPYMQYSEQLTEANFRILIEAISNDILNWDNVKAVMNNGGVTYAETAILTNSTPVEVAEVNHAKFISGSNLGINLKEPERIYPFYNPPGARGEDTFLSTCLADRKVLKVPCYTFHDGFSTYRHLLEGVLPLKLKFITADNPKVIERFYKACIGWIRYKPLLLYLTMPERYDQKIAEMRQQLQAVLPGVCAHFDRPEFGNILTELDKYDKNVRKHNQEFQETQIVWQRIMQHFTETNH